MLKLQIVLLYIFIRSLMSCGHITENKKPEYLDTSNYQVDTSQIAIFQMDSSTNNMLKIFKCLKSTELTNEDLRNIDTILNNLLKEYNKDREKSYYESVSRYPNSNINRNKFIIELSRYKRQYFPNMNENGEKEVWVNCFCDKWDNWQKELVFVIDGGNSYFNLVINLKTGKYFKFRINSIA